MADSDRAQEFIQNFLEHGNSLYDPVKAHEYYVRTRKLKGRHKGASLTQPPVSNVPKTPKPKQLTGLEKKVSVLQTQAQAKAKAIGDKLDAWAEAMSSQTRHATIKLSQDAKAQIAALPPIPKTITGDARAQLQQARAEKIAGILGQVRVASTALRNQASTQQKSKIAEAQAGVKAVADDLKKSIAQARKDYENGKTKTAKPKATTSLKTTTALRR